MSAPRAYCIATRRGALPKERALLGEGSAVWRGIKKRMQLPSQLSLADGGALRLCFARREEIGISPASCPVCHSANTRRSKRRSVLDHLFGVAGILPWRCESCATRFHARLLPFRTFLYAHCGICGNLELQRIPPERITGMIAIVARLLGIPALRCEPCRHKFFSARALHREERSVAPASSESSNR
jgi:hypothetical protein